MGISGGCQDLYSVYPTTKNQTCGAFTPPAAILGMKAISSATQSTFSRWGWPASCTDLELEPINDPSNGGIKGTPPYTLTVVPALHPPLNMTFGMLLFLLVAFAYRDVISAIGKVDHHAGSWHSILPVRLGC